MKKEFFGVICLTLLCCSCVRNAENNINNADFSISDVPEYVYDIGPTELYVHMVSSDSIDFWNNEAELKIRDVFLPYRPMENNRYKSKADSTNTFHFSFDIAGTKCVWFYYYQICPAVFYIEPNKVNEVWIDVNEFFKSQTYLYTNGSLDALNKVVSLEEKNYFNDIDQIDYSLVAFSPKCFVDTLIGILNFAMDSLRTVKFNSEIEEKYSMFKAVFLTNRHLSMYKNCRKDSTLNLTDTDCNRYFETVVVEERLFPYVLYLLVWEPDFARFIKVDNKEHESMLKFLMLTDSLERSEWKNYSDTVADYLGDKFYSKAIKFYYDKYRKWYNRINTEKSHPVNVPDVPNNELFNTIISNHKAKKLLITFWGVGCGPCQKEITEMEPLKTDDIEYVYISCPDWSPKAKYDQQIKMIKGYHYYVTDEQWNYMLDSFNVRGIPYNICMKSDGTTITHKGFQSVEAIFDSFKE